MQVKPKISLMFTSDEHGVLGPAPALQAKVEAMRQSFPSSSLLLSIGDTFQGSPESELSQGQPALEVMNQAQYAGAVVGNHDLDYGQAFLSSWAQRASFPLLSVNLRDSHGQSPVGIQPSLLAQLGDYKLGLIGVTTQTTPLICLPKNIEGLQFLDPGPLVAQEMERLRQQGADFFGLLCHTEEAEEELLASRVKGVEFILAGHTHQAYQEAKFVQGIPVYRPGCYRNSAGQLTLEIDPTQRRPVHQEWQLLVNDPRETHPGPMQDLVEQHMSKYREAMEVPVGFTSVPLTVDYQAQGDDLDPIVARAIAQEARCKIGFHNQKALRASLDEGIITRGELKAIFPFPNRVQRISVTPEELLQVVQTSEARDDHTSLFFHGLKVLRDVQGLAIGLQGLDNQSLAERLEVGTIDFLAAGGLGYFSDPKSGPLLGEMVQVLADGLGQHQSLIPSLASLPFGYRNLVE